MYIRLRKQSLFYSHVKMLLLTVFLHSVTLVGLKATLADGQPLTLDTMLLRSSEEKKQWWKRVEIMLPTAIAALVISGIAWNLRSQQTQPRTPGTSSKNRGETAPDAEKNEQETEGLQVPIVTEPKRAETVASHIHSDSSRSEPATGGSQAPTIIAPETIAPETNEATRSQASSTHAEDARVVEHTEQIDEALEKAKARYAKVKQNVALRGITLDEISQEGATVEAYDTAINNAINTFKNGTLTKIYGEDNLQGKLEARYSQEGSKNLLTSLENTFFADATDSAFINGIATLAQDAIKALPGYILTSDGVKELKTLNNTSAQAVDRLKAVISVFKDAAKQEPTNADEFLRYQGVDQQKAALKKRTFSAKFGTTEALKTLAKKVRDGEGALDQSVLQAIYEQLSDNNWFGGDANFKKEFSQWLSSKTSAKK